MIERIAMIASFFSIAMAVAMALTLIFLKLGGYHVSWYEPLWLRLPEGQSLWGFLVTAVLLHFLSTDLTSKALFLVLLPSIAATLNLIYRDSPTKMLTIIAFILIGLVSVQCPEFTLVNVLFALVRIAYALFMFVVISDFYQSAKGSDGAARRYYSKQIAIAGAVISIASLAACVNPAFIRLSFAIPFWVIGTYGFISAKLQPRFNRYWEDLKESGFDVRFLSIGNAALFFMPFLFGFWR